MRLLCLFLAGALILFGIACSRKPAYNNANANRSERNENQNRADQSTATPPDSTVGKVEQPAQPTAPTQADKPKIPSFFDQSKGEIKDLPKYPRAVIRGTQYGPMQGVEEQMSIALQSGDKMDDIAAFYEKVIKANGWTVKDKTRDPELSDWNLKKGEKDEAKIQVKKDSRQPGLTIVLVRLVKIPQPKK